MRIACFSLYGNFSPIMEQIGREIGMRNTLMIYHYRDYRKWWDGILNKPDNLVYNRGVTTNSHEIIYKFRPDLLIFDMSGEGELADTYKKSNWPVIGGSEFCDFIELNRWYGHTMMKSVGLSVPSAIEVKDYKAAVQFLRTRRDKSERWVIKFNDNQGNFSSYCSENIQDMLEELEHFMDANRVNFKSGAVLQEYVEGIEISCEGWFNGDTFIPDAFNYTMEEKKFLTGSLGPSTGCEGNLVWKASYFDPIPQQLYRMAPLLKKFGYIGPFDLNNIVCTKIHEYDGFAPLRRGANYILEPTPRFGYDAIYTLLEGFNGGLAGFFYDLYNRIVTNMKIIDEPLMGVRVSIPPYPYNDISPTDNKGIESLAKKTMKYMEKSVEGTITRLKKPELLRKVWFQDVRWDDKYKRLVVNGTDSVIAVCTAHAPTLEESIEEVYKVVKSVDVPNIQYRLDIGKRAFKEIPQLIQLKAIQAPVWWRDEKSNLNSDKKTVLLTDSKPNGSGYDHKNLDTLLEKSEPDTQTTPTG